MQQPANNPAPKKGFNWDLFLGRALGSCIVGCWIIGALLIIFAIVFFYMVANGFWVLH